MDACGGPVSPSRRVPRSPARAVSSPPGSVAYTTRVGGPTGAAPRVAANASHLASPATTGAEMPWPPGSRCDHRPLQRDRPAGCRRRPPRHRGPARPQRRWATRCGCMRAGPSRGPAGGRLACRWPDHIRVRRPPTRFWSRYRACVLAPAPSPSTS